MAQFQRAQVRGVLLLEASHDLLVLHPKLVNGFIAVGLELSHSFTVLRLKPGHDLLVLGLKLREFIPMSQLYAKHLLSVRV